MRRGHPRTAVWRNENPRHFRPRNAGTPHFMPSRGYGILETPRFPPPGPRPFVRPPFNPHQGPMIDQIPSDHDRRKYHIDNRHNSQQRPQNRQQYGQRQIFPLLQRMRHGDVPDHANQYKDTPNYYEDKNKIPSHNNMGDHRQGTMPQNRLSPWVNPPFYEHRSHKPYSHDGGEINRMPVQDYTGHRPPASDHYGGNPGSTIDNSNTFSRSVDDTVNIIRKRLLSRESQHSSEIPPNEQGECEIKPIESICGYANVHQDQPSQKKTHRQRQNVKSNCDKIKNKIVHQLFMMDKDKIHKLMDNPNSSTKFEYAISSLVTESQNSFNRHLRSVAEKSLCSSSTDFIHNDNNTIYEDTFMKQMQCILDPQDTVFLEDIKPMVLAELSKVLQLDEFEQRHEIDESTFPVRDEQLNFNQYPDEYNYEDYPSLETYSPDGDSAYYEQNPTQFGDENAEFQAHSQIPVHGEEKDKQCNFEPLFERRKSRKSSDFNEEMRASSENRRKEKSLQNNSSPDFSEEKRCSSEKRKEKSLENNATSDFSEERRTSSEKRRERSVENKSREDVFRRSGTPKPLFDGNAEQFSEDNDPFAEFDKQYHVAVDHNFIETDDFVYSPQPPVASTTSPLVNREVSCNFNISDKLPNYNRTHDIKTPDVLSPEIKNEIDSHLQNIAKSPLKISSLSKITIKDEPKSNQQWDSGKNKDLNIYSDHSAAHKDLPSKQSNSEYVIDTRDIKQEKPQEPRDSVEGIESHNINKSTTTPHTGKRSIDERPSHRKEKRKKSESDQSEANKQILNKNIIINVTDCASKSTVNRDAPKSVFNLFFSKRNTGKEASKECNKDDSVDKSNSDKYVKRREPRVKSKEREDDSKRKNDSSSSSHSMLSPTDNSNTNTNNPNSNKIDSKTKLKSIDIFGGKPRKSSSTHQAPRNTAPVPSTPKKIAIENKSKTSITRKLSRRHIATQVFTKCVTKETQTLQSKSSSSRYCQTDRKKLVTRGAQTTPVSIRSESSKSTDTFERMKEIDIEIQVLLQEKFKLYSSLESKSCPNTMKSLGMAVLNATPSENTEVVQIDDCNIDGDTIVESFTNIPVEELEQIALESVGVGESQSHETGIQIRRQKTKGERKCSVSPSTSTSNSRNRQKSKTSYISLIEQIITDERPLEDIISLDELEDPAEPRVKTKRKAKKPLPKKKSKKKRKTTKSVSRASSEVSFVLKNIEDYGLKECYVLLQRKDFNRYLQPKTKIVPESNDFAEPVVFKTEDNIFKTEDNIVEETVVNDLQFDMLDVSEDIVIGDNCEIKSTEDKDMNEREDIPICEDIILDNSQSSMEDAAGTEARPSDNECKMFDFSTDENLRCDSITVAGNGDAVLAIECVENNFIAACVDGNVYHFTGDGQLLNTLRGSNLAVTCLTIVKEMYGTTIYTGSLDSRIRYYDLETGLEKGPECNVLSPIQTMDRAWDTVFVGTKTGFVLQFECKNNMLIPVSTVKFSEQSILALRAMKEGPRKVLLVGARSEGVTIKDAQTGLLLRTLEGPKMTIYSLLFEDGKVYCGTSTHQIHVYDYASGSHVGVHEGGKGAVCLRAMGGVLFAGCYDGCVYVYREGEPRPLAQLRGAGHMLLSLAVVGSKIIAGYNDRSLYIWKIPLSILQEMIL